MLYTQLLITHRGSIKFSSEIQEPIKRTARLLYRLKSCGREEGEVWKKQKFELNFTEESEQSKVESMYQKSRPSEPPLTGAQVPFR